MVQSFVFVFKCLTHKRHIFFFFFFFRTFHFGLGEGTESVKINARGLRNNRGAKINLDNSHIPVFSAQSFTAQ